MGEPLDIRHIYIAHFKEFATSSQSVTLCVKLFFLHSISGPAVGFCHPQTEQKSWLIATHVALLSLVRRMEPHLSCLCLVFLVRKQWQWWYCQGHAWHLPPIGELINRNATQPICPNIIPCANFVNNLFQDHYHTYMTNSLITKLTASRIIRLLTL